MPDISGTELAVLMKEIQPELKVIIITGFADNLSEEGLIEREYLGYFKTNDIGRFQ